MASSSPNLMCCYLSTNYFSSFPPVHCAPFHALFDCSHPRFGATPLHHAWPNLLHHRWRTRNWQFLVWVARGISEVNIPLTTNSLFLSVPSPGGEVQKARTSLGGGSHWCLGSVTERRRRQDQGLENDRIARNTGRLPLYLQARMLSPLSTMLL